MFYRVFCCYQLSDCASCPKIPGANAAFMYLPELGSTSLLNSTKKRGDHLSLMKYGYRPAKRARVRGKKGFILNRLAIVAQTMLPVVVFWIQQREKGAIELTV